MAAETSSSPMIDTPRRPLTQERRRGQYKRYLKDPTIPIPRTTLWELRKCSQLRTLSSDSDPDSSSCISPISTSSSGSTFPMDDISPNNSFQESHDNSIPESPEDAHYLDDTMDTSNYSSSSEPEGPFFHEDTDDESNDNSFLSSSDSDATTEEETIPSDMFEPVYPGASISICGAYCSIMRFAISSKLPYTATEKLLKLLQLLCPTSNHLPTSFYKLKTFFQSFASGYETKQICPDCHLQLQHGEPCPNNHNRSGYMVHVPFKKSLQTVVENHWEDLQYPLQSTLYDGMIHDVWNGSAVKPLTVPGAFLSYPEHFGLILSTDGVPLFKSSSGSLWPIYVTIANLPPSIRANGANTLLCALWFGPTKPPLKPLLKPIADRLESLSTTGVMIKTPVGIKTIRAIPLMGIFDLVAKAPILNMKQFNGEYWCSTCTHPGTRLPNNTRVYLPNTEATLRTNASFLAAAEEAEATGNPVLGVKGSSVLAPSLNLVDGVPIDYMHAVLEGVTSSLMYKWFQSENHREAYYLGRRSREIDLLFVQQRPPHEFSRHPRALSTHLSYWKASEFRTWLLYYSLPLLMGYLPSLYLHHYALLATAMHILLQESIHTTEIDAAEAMLKDFVAFLPELYGQSSCTANAHSLTHLTKYVRLWGPLWTHSAFGFENKNSHLKHLFHSRSNVTDQLMFNTDVDQTLQLFHSTLCEQETPATAQFLSELSGNALRKSMKPMGEHIYTVGKIHDKTLTQDEAYILRKPPGTKRPTFPRMYIHGTMYHSLEYAKGQGKRDSSVCSLQGQYGIEFGQIEKFILNPHPMAIVRKFQPSNSTLLKRVGNPNRTILKEYQRIDITNSFVHEILPRATFTLAVIGVENIKSKAIYVNLDNSEFDYVLVEPNKYERH